MTLKHFETKINSKSKHEVVKELYEALKKIEKIEKEKEELEKELHKYKNANTPSSANKHIKPNTRGKQAKPNSQRGAPEGHTGTTRNQKPSSHEVIDTDQCPFCESYDIEDEKIITQIIEETPEPITPEVKKQEIHKKHCKNCGASFIPPQNTTPLKGKFGINVMVMVVFLKFILRGVLRKTASFLDNGLAFKVTPASINAIINRVADAADKEYKALKARIRTAAKVYVDETSFSVLGDNQWVWVFRTATDILLVIRPSRGSNVLKEILGADYAGTVICDCWRAYNFLNKVANLQRCWAHLLRKSKELIDSVPGRHFHEKLKAMFEETKLFNEKNQNEAQRLEKYTAMTNQLEKLITYYSRY